MMKSARSEKIPVDKLIHLIVLFTLLILIINFVIQKLFSFLISFLLYYNYFFIPVFQIKAVNIIKNIILIF